MTRSVRWCTTTFQPLGDVSSIDAHSTSWPNLRRERRRCAWRTTPSVPTPGIRLCAGATMPLLARIRPTAQSTTDAVLRAQFLRIYGQLQALRGEYAEAVPVLHEAIELLSDQPGIELTVTTEMLGATYAYMGEFERALELVETAHARSEAIQDQAALAAGEAFLSAV